MSVWEAVQTLGAMLGGFVAALVVLAYLADWMVNR